MQWDPFVCKSDKGVVLFTGSSEHGCQVKAIPLPPTPSTTAPPVADQQSDTTEPAGALNGPAHGGPVQVLNVNAPAQAPNGQQGGDERDGEDGEDEQGDDIPPPVEEQITETTRGTPCQSCAVVVLQLVLYQPCGHSVCLHCNTTNLALPVQPAPCPVCHIHIQQRLPGSVARSVIVNRVGWQG